MVSKNEMTRLFCLKEAVSVISSDPPCLIHNGTFETYLFNKVEDNVIFLWLQLNV